MRLRNSKAGHRNDFSLCVSTSTFDLDDTHSSRVILNMQYFFSYSRGLEEIYSRLNFGVFSKLKIAHTGQWLKIFSLGFHLYKNTSRTFGECIFCRFQIMYIQVGREFFVRPLINFYLLSTIHEAGHERTRLFEVTKVFSYQPAPTRVGKRKENIPADFFCEKIHFYGLWLHAHTFSFSPPCAGLSGSRFLFLFIFLCFFFFLPLNCKSNTPAHYSHYFLVQSDSPVWIPKSNQGPYEKKSLRLTGKRKKKEKRSGIAYIVIFPWDSRISRERRNCVWTFFSLLVFTFCFSSLLCVERHKSKFCFNEYSSAYVGADEQIRNVGRTYIISFRRTWQNHVAQTLLFVQIYQNLDSTQSLGGLIKDFTSNFSFQRNCFLPSFAFDAEKSSPNVGKRGKIFITA